MKKVVIDCRYLGMSGIGRVLEGFLTNLDSKNEYYFLGDTKKLAGLGITTNIIEDLSSPVSKKGMIRNKEVNKYDVFFTPNFIIPYGIKIPVYSMIHDLMFYDFKDTTNGKLDQLIKSHFYKRCMKKSKAIFTVSQFSKDRILHYFPKCKKNIILVYNGLSNSIMEYKKNHSSVEKKNYILFVGNMKKQKGISTLLKAVDGTDTELYLIGEKDRFRTSDDTLSAYFDKPNIHFTGKVSDDDLFRYVSEAKFLIQPSLYEGFGLPPLEALYLGTKPIISDIPVFEEIYKELDVIYFKASDSLDLKEKLSVSDSKVKPLNEEVLVKYSYKNGFSVISTEISK